MAGFAQMGIDDAQAREMTGVDVETFFHVWPENVEVLSLFLGLRTQWRRAGMDGQLSGLDYAAVESYLRLLQVNNRQQVFTELQLAESAALSAIREKA